MSMRVSLHPSFVLHSRAFRNTSLLVELFAEQYGRVSVVARSARGLKSRYKGVLQVFTPLLVSWSGRQELMTLGQVELSSSPINLQGDGLLCGFYLNELLLRLLQRDDPYPKLFALYQRTLYDLTTPQKVAVSLRLFEKKLLELLGYAIPLQRTAEQHLPIQPHCHYQYVPERGFYRCESSVNNNDIFIGSSIIALQREEFTDAQSLKDAKRLMRLILGQYLGAKPLKSRELFAVR